MQDKKTKLVSVTLAAITRVEYSETIEVPVNFSEDDIQRLVDQRWDDVDGGEFEDDADFWERGNCYGEVLDQQSSESPVNDTNHKKLSVMSDGHFQII